MKTFLKWLKAIGYLIITGLMMWAFALGLEDAAKQEARRRHFVDAYNKEFGTSVVYVTSSGLAYPPRRFYVY